ncbi:MAG TPA: VOC family protein [Actinomycetota bacterium]|nr:VOC family protein [Actinomycetota bacterium]
MGRPVVHFEILGSDAAKLQAFYRELFDWTIHQAPMDYGLVHTEAGTGIDGGIGKSEKGPAVNIYIEVDDLQAHLDEIEQMGGKTVVPVTEIPGQVTFAQFADPEGNVVGLVKSEQS